MLTWMQCILFEILFEIYFKENFQKKKIWSLDLIYQILFD